MEMSQSFLRILDLLSVYNINNDSNKELFGTALRNELSTSTELQIRLVFLLSDDRIQNPLSESIRTYQFLNTMNILINYLEDEDNIKYAYQVLSKYRFELNELVNIDTEVFMQHENQLKIKNILERFEEEISKISSDEEVK
jgi:hypothetical protein